MAVTLTMKDDIKLDRVDIIKTVISHGWELYSCMQDDGQKNFNRIKDATIYNYLIRARTRLGDMLVIYQPNMNEITVIGKNGKTENKMKQEIANIIGKNKKGSLYKNKDMFFNGLLYHKRFLTDTEITDIVSELDKPGDLPYFA